MLDFGLVGDDLAPESAVIGTIAYMAPEQAAGRPVGASADWYSMGVLLYEALVGRPPFMGKALEVLADKQSRIPPRPSQIARQLPQDLDALCMDLLRTEPGKRPDYPEILRRLQPSLLVQTEIEVSGRCFVGRSAELEKLSQALAETRRGQPRTILLHGESGVGKSALMRHFAHLATTQSAGLVVLTGRCYEHESVPFKAIDGLIDNLARLLRKWPEARVASILPRRVSALLQAFPVLGMVPTLAEAPSGRFAPTADPHEQRLRVFAALRELLGRLAERQPLLIMIDDLQWTDGDSLALLANLMSPPDEHPLMLVATVRLGTHVLRGTWLDIERAESAVHHIRIDQLPHSEALILAQALAGPSSSGEHRRLQRLVEEARGHPLFIQELVRHTLSHGTEEPPRLDDTIWARIGELAEPAQRLLRLCAVMGSPLPVDVATQASSLLPEEVERALIQLRAANLLRASLSGHEPDSGARDIRAVEPYHDRIRELVSERLPPEGRQECHQRLAQALEKTKSTDPEALTYHFSSAGETDKAGPYALQAGDKAATTLAFERAARFYGQALEWLRLEDAQRRDLLIKRANALANAGHEYQASKWLIQAAETAEPEVASDLRRRASDQLLRSGHHREGVRLLREAFQNLGLRLFSSAWGAIFSMIGYRLWLSLRGLQFKERSEKDLSSKQLARLDLLQSAATGIGFFEPINGAAIIARLLLMSLDAGEPLRLALVLVQEAITIVSTQSARNWPRGEHILELSRSIVKRLDNPYAHAHFRYHEAIMRYVIGEWKLANKLFDEGLHLLQSHCIGTAWDLSVVKSHGLVAKYFLGDLRALEKNLPHYIQDADARNDLFCGAFLCGATLPILNLMHDNVNAPCQEAIERLERVQFPTFGLLHYNIIIWSVNALLYKEQGRQAYEYRQREMPWLTGVLLRAGAHFLRILDHDVQGRCAVAAALERESSSRRLIRQAEKSIRVLEGEERPWATAFARNLRAALTQLKGDMVPAAHEWEQAAQSFDTADMKIHAAAARRRQGQALGDERGRALIEAADQTMRNEGIKNPARWTAMLAPANLD